MRKCILGLAMVLGLTSLAYAEATSTSAAPAAQDTTISTDVTTAPITEAAAPPVAEVAPVEAAPAAATTAETVATENLEFISGEVSVINETTNAVTIKLYGETENAPGDKSITVTVEPTTDITDGEKDRALKSLAGGTEVDVEYDPATNKATYIFVY